MGVYGDRFNLAVAAELRAQRGRTKQTVADLVDATGLSKNTILNYLNGQRAIPLTALSVLCRALGVSPHVVVDAAEKMLEQGSD